MTMRTFLLAVALAAVCVGASRAQSQASKHIVYFSSDRPRTVSMSTAGSGVASFIVPVGTIMAVSYESASEPNLTSRPFKAHGAIQIRLLPESERHGGPQAEAILLAPVVVSGEHVDLTIVDGR